MRRTSGRAAAVALAIACLGVPGPVAAGDVPITDADFELRLFTLRAHRRPAAPQPITPPRPLSGQADFDVLDYEITLSVDPLAERVGGTNLVTFTPSAGVPDVRELVLDAHDALVIDEVTDATGRPLAFQRLPSELRVQLANVVEVGELGRVAVRWSGAPPQDLGTGLQFTYRGRFPDGHRTFYSMSEPYHARDWWPCKDRPDDKATLTLRVDAPDDLVVVGPGRFVSRIPSIRESRMVTTWREDSVIATYLVWVAGARYAQPDAVDLAWDHVSPTVPAVSTPLSVWAFEDDVVRAQGSWSVLPDMMAAFEDAFGVYPFAGEKYGHVEVQVEAGDRWAAMENQTASAFSALLCTGTDAYEHVVAHELAHQWFGDSVTPAGFDSLWLNEGFASWAEARWREVHEGESEYFRVLRTMDPLLRTGEFPGTVDDFEDADADGWPDGDAEITIYFKGAWVLHMLRGVLAPDGDAEPLLGLLRAWHEERRHGIASTEDFVGFADRHAMQHHGLAGGLRPFFEQWLSRTGRPCYEVGWSASPRADGRSLLHVHVEQKRMGWDLDAEALACVEPLPAPYRMPVQLEVAMPGGTITERVQNDALRHRYELVVDEPPTGVAWDAPGWVLKRVESVDIDEDDDGWPDELDGCPHVPNPEQADADEDGRQDACQPGLDGDGDRVPNELDCAPADGDAWTPPEARPQARLFVAKEPSGALVLRWELPDAGVERPYVADATWGRLERLHANRAPIDLRCIVAGSPDGEAVAPAITGNAYFLALPWNGCGPRDAAGATVSPCR